MAKLKLNKREVWALKYIIIFHIYRYMMCNSKGREDGIEKAEEHIAISEKLAMFFLCEGEPREGIPRNVRSATMEIHNYLAEILTDRMDEVIGYPVNKQMYADDFALYSRKFFDVILNHTKEIRDIAFKTKLKNDLYEKL